MEHQFNWTLTKEDIESILGRAITEEEFLGVIDRLKVELPYEAFALASWRAYKESISPTPDSAGFLLSVTLEEALNTSVDEFRTIVSDQFKRVGFTVENVWITPVAIDGDRIVYMITANEWKVIQ